MKSLLLGLTLLISTQSQAGEEIVDTGLLKKVDNVAMHLSLRSGKVDEAVYGRIMKNTVDSILRGSDYLGVVKDICPYSLSATDYCLNRFSVENKDQRYDVAKEACKDISRETSNLPKYYECMLENY